MLEMIRGCKVPFIDKLAQQYQVQEQGIIANVGADKMQEVFEHFITLQNNPLFFILELPTNQNDEQRLRENENSPAHKDIYYIDGLNAQQALQIFGKYKELLIHDGMCQFGFGVHDYSAEIMKNSYNIVTIWTQVPDQYQNVFKEHGIEKTNKLITAWNTFNYDNPGQCRMIEVDGMCVYDLPRELEQWGIYLAEQRPE